MESFAKKETVYVELELNARLQPIHRCEIFEDLFENVFKSYEIGEVIGAGTLQKATGEVEKCDIKMDIYKEKLNAFISYLQKIDIIPKGSTLFVNKEAMSIGSAEGMALYLNGTDLPVEVYQNNDVNELIALLDQALNNIAHRLSYWEGSAETALYYYGKDYFAMKNSIAEIVESHPLCQKCRIVKIA